MTNLENRLAEVIRRIWLSREIRPDASDYLSMTVIAISSLTTDNWQLTTYSEPNMANGEAIGLIETKGIVAAVEACDAALKAANVQFVEQHKVGSGLVAITLKGDVAAVRAAVDAGAEAA